MTENEFKGLFGEDFEAVAESLANAEAEELAAKAATPQKDGLWYVHDGVDGNGHTISWYALTAGGKTLLWASVDSDATLTETTGVIVPPGVTAHAIRVHNATRTASVATTGVAARGPHKDGVHVDGNSVRSYVLPRTSRWIVHFYGV